MEIQDERDFANRLGKIELLILGDPEIDEIGIKRKVDEMHKLLTKASGVPWLISIIILTAAGIAALKTFFNHQ